MPRQARIVIPGVPHHVTQRGNRKQCTFFCEDDYRTYIEIMALSCQRFGVDVWAYCLMPNHVHLVVVPRKETSLAAAIGTGHENYTRTVNAREGWSGHLWQGRFFSVPMDEHYLMACVRYVEMNPVKPGLCRNPWTYRWSSCRAHMLGVEDPLVNVRPMSSRVDDWRHFLGQEAPANIVTEIRNRSRTGQPLAAKDKLLEWEKVIGRSLIKGPSEK